MRDDDKTDLPGWLGLRRDPDFDKARWLGSALSVVAVVLFVMAVAVVMAVLGHALFDFGIDAPRIGFGTGAVAVALIGAPFVIWRSVVAQKTVTLQEQGHITDRINTAVQGLGAEKTVKRDSAEYTQPNLEVRIGAIYALERIAQDSDRDHVQIMEILCAYIRQNAPAPAEDDWPELKMKDSEEEGPLEADWDDRLKTFRKEQNEKKATLKLREDIQVALTVIGRRSSRQRRLEAGRGVEADVPFDAPLPEYEGHDPEALSTYLAKLKTWKKSFDGFSGYRLDLRGANLCGSDFAQLNLKGAKLDRTYLQGANLNLARLQGADLFHARFQGATLWMTQLQGAFLVGARLQGANLWQARLQEADLWDASLQGTEIVGARLQGTDLVGARLQGAFISAARFQGTDLSASHLQGAYLQAAYFDRRTVLTGATLQRVAVQDVDFSDIPQMEKHLPHMFGDTSVTLPGGHGPDHESWPNHWPTVKLNPEEFHIQWQAWLKDLQTETPSDPSEPDDPA